MNVYVEKSNYVESLNKTLSVLQDFESISYAWDALTGSEYVKISDTLGGYVCLDVTGGNVATILENVVKTLLLGDTRPPMGIVHDRERLRKIAPLFRRAN